MKGGENMAEGLTFALQVAALCMAVDFVGDVVRLVRLAKGGAKWRES